MTRFTRRSFALKGLGGASLVLGAAGLGCGDGIARASVVREDNAPPQGGEVAPPLTGGAVPNGPDEPSSAGQAATAAPAAPEILTYEVVATYPHDPAAFTEGLIVASDGTLLESVGLYGQSSLRRVDLATGAVLAQRDIPRPFFAEGLTVLDGRAYQLTWQEHRAFVYDAVTFEPLEERSYPGEGWGLTTDGQALIMSDGTSRLRFLDPATFAELRTVDVQDRGTPIDQINELEYVGGQVLANIWHDTRIARIDPATGAITAWLDLASLVPAAVRRNSEAVVNGIAYDAAGDHLYVTGKLWPQLYEIRLLPA